MIRALAIAVLIALASGPAGADDPMRMLVYDLITQRLALMKPVAAWKHARGTPVEDLEREAVVVDRAAADAALAGLDPETARPFFVAQIEAAKAIQICWIARWEADEAAKMTDPPDLNSEIRPELLAIGTTLLDAIRLALAEGVDFDPDNASKFWEAVDLDCLDPAARDAIHRRLGGIRLAR
ncbi:MAG: gamma subclass chorismate mutase AroQ [Paracoccaceae bacterium]|nr:gamma subclass chorismate mutase AroQ [Paracoccaceae bacterium]